MGASAEVHFVGQLIEKTTSGRLTWNYLLWNPKNENDINDPREGNPELISVLDSQTLYDNEKRELIFDRTFWTKSQTGYIYYVSSAVNNRTSSPVIYMQRNKTSKIHKLSRYIDDSDLYHLENAIVYSLENSNFEEVDSFINDFLKEE